ncbi:MAG: UDP-2,4-diacetamido-2,4,6-trideoxy-beta-L-altropyranose hydrolase, partial [Oceanisphaera sp.]|uniref:UDP-2,4-diacetamido-2,4, 6-trideoxy-beta-L-altropyranose hydrolase n=1 Tax=Oceanisphaera sp. TaxID=1929979 RepID=UPI003C779561
MRVAFRADASLQIGTGHVMRCLTLADALKANGAECYFICREHSGNLISFIQNKGYVVYTLPYLETDAADFIAEAEAYLAHAAWLGASQQQDAEQCRAILTRLQPDLLIVDHYALDICWEKALSAYYRRLMVIDDLADRPHDCGILLDQTFGRNADDYSTLVSDSCVLLCGSSYALLRPEFSTLRGYSLQRRENPKLEHLLITMGGVDKDNATGQVLEALRTCELPEQCRITVVMGATAPWLANIRQLA